MINILYVALGGAIGALLRYLTSNFFKILFPNFLLGTFFVNILGSFLIGFLVSSLENKIPYDNFIKYFLIIGVLGSFTTFSAFSIEVVELYNNNKILLSLAYIFTSLFFCISAAYVGYNINKI